MSSCFLFSKFSFFFCNWDAASSFCVGFLTRLRNVSKNCVLVLFPFCITAERSVAKLSQSDSQVLESISRKSDLHPIFLHQHYHHSVEGLTFSVEGEWMGLIKLKNYIPLILCLPSQARRNEKNSGGGARVLGVYQRILANLVSWIRRLFNWSRL